jgi:polysaccharide export outer membrane protein
MRRGFTVPVTLLLLSGWASGQQSVTKPVIAAPEAQTTSAPAPPVDLKNTAPPADSTGYVIGPEDTLQIIVFKQPDVSGTYTVRIDGMISLPLVAEGIQAAGLTPSQLSAVVTERLKKLIREVYVTVNVTSVHPKIVFVSGQVNHEGQVTLTPGMTPIQAIATAGGPSLYANTKRVRILRTVNGSQKVIPFNYKKAVENGDQQGVTLQPGDTIYIP